MEHSPTSKPVDAPLKKTLFPAFLSAGLAQPAEVVGAMPATDTPQWLSNKSFDVNAASVVHQQVELTKAIESEQLRAVERECSANVQDVERRASTTSTSSSASGYEPDERRHRGGDRSPASREASNDGRDDEESTEGLRQHRDAKKRKKNKHHKKKKKKRRKHSEGRADDRERHSTAHSSSGTGSDVRRLPVGGPVSAAAAGVKAAVVEARGSSKVFLEDMPNLEPVHAYRIDKERDVNNLAYESLYKLHIARSHRVVTVPLGLRAGQWVELASRGSSSKRQARHRGSHGSGIGRYFAKDFVAASYARTEATTRTSCRITDAASREATEYLRLSVSEAGQMPLGSDAHTVASSSAAAADEHGSVISGGAPTGVYDRATHLYSLGRAAPPSAEPQADGPSDASSARLRRTGDYNRRLREVPTDVDLWLEFVAYQDEAALDGGFDDASAADGETVDAVLKAAEQQQQQQALPPSQRRSGLRSKAILEKKLAVLDKALAANPSSVRLKAARLRIGDQLWDDARIGAEWLAVLHVHVNDAGLWLEYLRHCRSGPLSRFEHSRVEAAYEKCLRSLRSVLQGDMKSHPCLPGTAEHMLDIFVDYCYYLQQSGYTEKATGLFQAMIEFNCFAPVGAGLTTREDLLRSFRGFWHRRLARFGETGAKGWCAWQAQHADETMTAPMQMLVHEETAEEERVLGPYATAANSPGVEGVPKEEGESARLSAAWLALECMRERIHWLPWRPFTDDEGDAAEPDDPQRDVAAEAVLPLLFRLSSVQLQLDLCHAFLDFLSVDGDGRGGCSEGGWMPRLSPPLPRTLDSPDNLGLELPGDDDESAGAPRTTPQLPVCRRRLVVRPGDSCHRWELFAANCLTQLQRLPSFAGAESLRPIILRDIRHLTHCALRRLLSEQQQLTVQPPRDAVPKAAEPQAAAAAESKKLRQLLKDKLQGSACSSDAAVLCTFADAERLLGNDASWWRTYAALMAAEQQQQQLQLLQPTPERSSADAASQPPGAGLQSGPRLPTTGTMVLAAYARAECSAAASHWPADGGGSGSQSCSAAPAPAAADPGDAELAADRLLSVICSFALGVALPANTSAAGRRLTAPQLLKAKAVLRATVDDEAERLLGKPHSSAAASGGSVGGRSSDAAYISSSWPPSAAAAGRYAAAAFCLAVLESLTTTSAGPRVAADAARTGVRRLLTRDCRQGAGGGVGGEHGSWRPTEEAGAEVASGRDAASAAAALRLLLDCIVLLQLLGRLRQPGAGRCLRQTLELGIASFPHSAALLRTYVVVERRSHAIGRARRLLSSVARLPSVSAEQRGLLRCFGAYFELLRCHDIREASGLLTSAIASEYLRTMSTEADMSASIGRFGAAAVESSVLFWRLCLLHEAVFGTKESAKGIFYRALQHTPWAKSLYMDAIGFFPEMLEDLLRLMEEKGIRVRVPSTQELQMLLEMAALRVDEASGAYY